MTDQILVCANCGNEFLFTVGEQEFYKSKGLPAPKYCPICRSIKSQEKKLPPKPKPSI